MRTERTTIAVLMRRPKLPVTPCAGGLPWATDTGPMLDPSATAPAHRQLREWTKHERGWDVQISFSSLVAIVEERATVTSELTLCWAMDARRWKLGELSSATGCPPAPPPPTHCCSSWLRRCSCAVDRCLPCNEARRPGTSSSRRFTARANARARVFVIWLLGAPLAGGVEGGVAAAFTVTVRVLVWPPLPAQAVMRQALASSARM